jgi:hypothetical protein
MTNYVEITLDFGKGRKAKVMVDSIGLSSEALQAAYTRLMSSSSEHEKDLWFEQVAHGGANWKLLDSEIPEWVKGRTYISGTKVQFLNRVFEATCTHDAVNLAPTASANWKKLYSLDPNRPWWDDPEFQEATRTNPTDPSTWDHIFMELATSICCGNFTLAAGSSLSILSTTRVSEIW